MPVSFSIADSSDGPRKVVIWVTGDLDADTGRAVRARLGQAQRHARSDVILDMTGVTFIDSVALTSLVSGARQMEPSSNLQVIPTPEFERGIYGVGQPLASAFGLKKGVAAKAGERQFMHVSRLVGSGPTHAPMSPVHKVILAGSPGSEYRPRPRLTKLSSPLG